MEVSLLTGLLQTHKGHQFYSDQGTYDRFISYVSPDGSGCWLWTGATARGYGHFGVKTPTGRKMLRCNIYAHAAFNHQISPVVRHTCDNRLCVNPAHLISGTHQDNMRDRTERGRNARGSSVVRSTHKTLNEDLVRQIFKLKETGMKQKDIAESLDTSTANVSRVLSRKVWGWVSL